MSDEILEEVVEEPKDEWSVKLQNFQSIINGEIKIPRGITIVTGDTNQGKTAFIRAIDYACYNTGTDEIVRAGTKIAGVTISNGRHTMTYCRNAQGKNEKTAYQFDGGEVQRKVGRAQLPEVVNMFGIRDVRMQNGIKMKLNFWYQGDKPFLSDKTSGQLYEFLTLSSCDKYVKVLKQMVTDIKIQEAEINNCNVRIDTLRSINNHKQEYLDNNKGFDDVYERVIIASASANKINNGIGLIDSIQDITDDIDDTKDNLTRVSESLSQIDFDGVSDTYDRLISVNSEYSKLYEIMCDIKKLKDSIADIKKSIAEVSERYTKTSKSEKLYEKRVTEIETLNSRCAELFNLSEECLRDRDEIDKVKNSIDRIKDVPLDIESTEARIKKAEGLTNSYNLLDAEVRELKTLRDSIKTLKSERDDVSERLKTSESDLEKFKSEVGYCPFCGTVFEKCNH